jgi:hypothetical protein
MQANCWPQKSYMNRKANVTLQKKIPATTFAIMHSANVAKPVYQNAKIAKTKIACHNAQ